MKNHVRIIEGSMQPGDAFWRFVDAAKSESGETELDFFGPISEFSWWGDEITPKTFKDELYAKAKGGPVTMKVHSPGGDLFAGVAIRNTLIEYPGRVTADIVGLAASAATIVVGGADRVKMHDTAMFMIHDPSTIAWGTLEEMRQVVTVLEQAKETILNGYQARTKLSREELAKMMRDETWMTADQAKEFGFVDEVISQAPEKEKAKATKAMRAAFLNCLGGYRNVPEDLTTEITEISDEEGQENEVVPAEETSAEADNGAETLPSPSPLPAGEGQKEGKEEQELRERVQTILKGI